MRILYKSETVRYFVTLFALFATLLLVRVNVVSAGDTGAGLCSYEMDLFRRINQYRTTNGLTALKYDNLLQTLARGHSRNMEKTNCLSHDAFHDRFEKCGRLHCVENVGWNSATPEGQLRAWEKSEGHNTNLLNKKIRFAGISKIGAFVTFFACD